MDWLNGQRRQASSTGGDTGIDFTTSGSSREVDKLFVDDLIIGAGMSYGRDDTDVDNDASSSKVDSFSAAV